MKDIKLNKNQYHKSKSFESFPKENDFFAFNIPINNNFNQENILFNDIDDDFDLMFSNKNIPHIGSYNDCLFINFNK